MVVAVVGDVKAAEVVPIVEKYFGRLPRRPSPRRCARTSRPRARSAGRPPRDGPAVLRRGLPPPEVTHPDDAIYDVISDLLSSGRTSRLYRSLVRDKKIAAQAAGFPGFPGEKYPNLFVVFGCPRLGTRPTRCETRSAPSSSG